ncbi:DUF3906 family protein [Paenibacillus alkalitolerans]|uniref:DUF3906 family protein n=1 Tax=Paenibacillus alkalitolerans TaxID=2799335 RepID=UPI0018F5538F|nr:DUF3906 family protein [Paenibacillus alkalitolerans]
MYLYKIEMESDRGECVAIVLAEDDEKAFAAAEEHLQRHYVAMPAIRSSTIVEKKRSAKGAGYIIDASRS